MNPLLLGMLNTPEIIALLVLALILFGAKKLPELAKGLGHGIKEFKKASRDVTDELNNALYTEAPPPPPRKPTPAPAPEPQSPTATAQSESDLEPPAKAS